MLEGSQEYERARVALPEQLAALSAREQIEMILHGIRSLSNKERAEILSVTGIHFLTYSGINYALRFLFKRFVQGILWSIIFGVALVFCVIGLILLQANPDFFFATVAVIGAFFAGFLIYTVVDFLSDAIPLFIRPTPRQQWDQLALFVDNLERRERVTALRSLGLHLSRRFSGASLVEAILSGIVVSILGVLIIIALLIVSFILLSTFKTTISPFLPYVDAIVAFIAGFFVPRRVQRRLSAMLRRKKKVAPKETVEK